MKTIIIFNFHPNSLPETRVESKSENEIATFHNTRNFSGVFDVDDRVRIKNNEVGELPLLQGSQLILASHHGCRIFCSGHDDVAGAHPRVGHEFEFLMQRRAMKSSDV